MPSAVRRRGVLATRNVVKTLPLRDVRSTGAAVTLPWTVMRVSFMVQPPVGADVVGGFGCGRAALVRRTVAPSACCNQRRRRPVDDGAEQEGMWTARSAPSARRPVQLLARSR